MIEELKNDDLINRIGGRFKFTAMIQKRWRELMFGARPMIEPGRLSPLEIAIKEIAEGKIHAEAIHKGDE
ncbi:MAG: DNA-directed RNA polymerase subunit omega [Planctomycetes bacterium]|nr:DNA-directed RNA polymerase subunit omega [Planctomycetota bacterium]